MWAKQGKNEGSTVTSEAQLLTLANLARATEQERLLALNESLKDLIKDLRRVGVTYRDLQEICGVEENAIKQYMFRKSQRPRFTNLVQRLSSAVDDLASAGRIVGTPALAVFQFCRKARLLSRHHTIREQLNSFYGFISNKNHNRSLEIVSSIISDFQRAPSIDQSSANLKFFCYKKSRSRAGYIVKSEYNFYTDPDVSKDECFFMESIPGKNGDLRERHGLARMADNLITLFFFQQAELTATHLRCVYEKKRAYGVTVSGDASGLSIELAIFVPEGRVENKDLGFFDSVSNSAGAELADFKEGFYELYRAI